MSIWLDNAAALGHCARTLDAIAKEYEAEGNASMAAEYREKADWHMTKSVQHYE